MSQCRIGPQYITGDSHCHLMSSPQDDVSAFCTMPYHYGSMRIDPVASVGHLNDHVAEAEARKLHTRRYLVYLYHVGTTRTFLLRQAITHPTYIGAHTSVPGNALVLLHSYPHSHGTASPRSRERDHTGDVHHHLP